MSEESNATSNAARITSGAKEKDPRRVAAGKRLGEISKRAKEAKRAQRAAQAQQSVAKDHDTECGGYAVYVVGGLIAMGALFYLWLGSSLRLPAVCSLWFGQLKSASDLKPTECSEGPTNGRTRSGVGATDKLLPSSPKKKSNRVFANE